MINGDYNMFINDLHYGAEMNFSYKDRKYFIESFYKEGMKKIIFSPTSNRNFIFNIFKLFRQKSAGTGSNNYIIKS